MDKIGTIIKDPGGLQYRLDREEAVILRYEGDAERLELPETLGGLPVRRIERLAFANYKAKPNPYIIEMDTERVNRLDLREILLPETLEEIGEMAFCGLRSLERITLPASVRSVGDFSFLGCSLEELELPEGVTRIAPYLFYGCRKLRRVGVRGPVRSVGYSAFDGCEALESLELPDTVEYLGQLAFRDSGLRSFRVPAGVEQLEYLSFSNCRNLTSVVLPEGLRVVAFHAFENCSALENLRIPASLVNLGGQGSYGNPARISPNGQEYTVFGGCTGLRRFTVAPENPVLRDLDGILYSRDGKTLILCPPALEAPVRRIPEGVEKILGGGFRGNSFLRRVECPDSLTSIGNSAFQNCLALEEIRFSPGLESIGHQAFSGCPALELPPLPESLRFLGEDPFSGCHQIQSLWIPDRVKSPYLRLNNMAGLRQVRIPLGVEDLGTFRACPNLEEIQLPPGHPKLEFRDHALYEKRAQGKPQILRRFMPGVEQPVMEIPEGLRIKPDAFQNCRFRELRFPDSRVYIPAAFQDCRFLERIRFPQGLREIATFAFSGCTSLREIQLPEGTEEVGNYSFSGCTALERAVLPPSLRKYGVCLFVGCTALKEVVLTGGKRTWVNRKFIKDRRANFPEQAVFLYR